ncbi:MAG TPA: FliH/SctL family protein [Terracidiphilus sp.]|nr:FliH/SctL family protein [Terracidiphilus sp.]
MNGASPGKGSLQQEGALQGSGEGDGVVESFAYHACPIATSVPAWDGWVEAEENAAAEPLPDGGVRPGGRVASANFEERLAEETRQAFESGRERGREEGRRAEREALAPSAAAEADRHRRQTAELVENLARERDRYLQAIEQEAVRLALAVSARILRREAQMDPLLLSGAVRVALGQLAATSEIRLRVPAKEADMWKETIAQLPKLTVKPLVVADEAMLLGECLIESKVGTVDLGIRSQLGEIERGFFDRAVTSDAPTRPAQTSTALETWPVGARA